MLNRMILLLCACALVSAAFVNKKEEDFSEWEPSPHQYSQAAKARLQQAAVRAISHLCLGEEIDDEIMNTICRRAIATELGKRSGGVERRSCWDCSIADPVCFNTCPQR